MLSLRIFSVSLSGISLSHIGHGELSFERSSKLSSLLQWGQRKVISMIFRPRSGQRLLHEFVEVGSHGAVARHHVRARLSRRIEQRFVLVIAVRQYANVLQRRVG